MASSITFSGLSSGLDSASIISQLMTVEAIPQNRIKTSLSNEQTKLSALQSLNTTIAGISTAAASFAGGSTWTQLNATSSNSAITVTAASSAIPASVNLSVTSLATASMATLTSAPTNLAGGAFTIYGDDGATSLATFDVTGTNADGSASMSDIATAINTTTSSSHLRAVIISSTDANGNATPVLQVMSTTTGSNSGFSISGTDSSGGAVSLISQSDAGFVKGTDAQVTVNNQNITSHSNTFDVMTGVTVTLGANAAAANANTTTISVSNDGSSRASALNSFINQLNSLMTTISGLTSYGNVSTTAGTAGTGAGVLEGDSTLRSIATQLVNTIFPPDGSSMSSIGISIDRYGRFTFDQSKFNAAYAADPAKTQAAILGTPKVNDAGVNSDAGLDSFINRVQKVTDLATYSSSSGSSKFITGAAANQDGWLTTLIKSDQSAISQYTDQIADWDDRLAAKKSYLTKLYTNLETVMSKYQAQSSWLSSQIAGLDANDSSK